MQNQGNTKLIGNDGENRACAYYQSLGFTVVERNFRVRRGEIDIILEKFIPKKNAWLLVFSEVKTLPNGNPEILSGEINKIKQGKIVETAKYFLQKHRKYSNSIIRFDAVVVDMPGFEPVHLIENAFSE